MKITHRLLDPASDTDMFLIRWACLAPNNVPFGAEDGFDWESWTPSHTGVKYIASYVNCVYVGIGVDGFADLQVGDQIEAYVMEAVAQKLVD